MIIIFRKFLISSLMMGILLMPTWVFAAPNAASPYDDEFSTPVLGSQWSWTREDAGAWSFEERAGYLRMHTRFGTLHGSNLANNVLLQPAPPPNYEIAAGIEISPTMNYQEVSLLLYQDDDNYIKLSRLYQSGEGGNVYLFVHEQDGVIVHPQFMRTRQTTFELRISVSEKLAAGWVQNASGVWCKVGAISLAGGKTFPYIGISAHHGVVEAASIPVDFDFFRASLSSASQYQLFLSFAPK